MSFYRDPVFDAVVGIERRRGQPLAQPVVLNQKDQEQIKWENANGFAV